MNSRLDAKWISMAERAIEIADDSMAELVRCHCLRIDEFGMTWAVVNESHQGIHDLSEAEHCVQEAIGWLQQRSLVEVVESPDGLTIILDERIR